MNLSVSIIFERIVTVLFTIFFMASYNWSYIEFLQPLYSYIGFPMSELSTYRYTIIFFVILAPSIWLPLNVNKPSRLLTWFLFILVYIPTLIFISYSSIPLSLFYTIFVGFLIISLSTYFPRVKINYQYLNRKQFQILFFGLLILLSVILIYFEGKTMKLVNVFDLKAVYSQRFNKSGNRISAYAMLWLSGIFFPILLTLGLIYKRYFYLILGIIGQCFVFMVGANKAFIFSIFLMIGVYFLIKNNKFRYIGLKFLAGSTLLIYLVTSTQLYASPKIKLITYPLATQVLDRTYSIGGFNFFYYYDFFQSHPYTYYSHIGVVSKFIDYPFDRTLGKVITWHYFKSSSWNSNANFWITDGYAALGSYGVIIISFFCLLLFLSLDLISYKFDKKFLLVLVSYFIIPIFNISIFTTLLSGGLGFCVLFLLFMKPYYKN